MTSLRVFGPDEIRPHLGIAALIEPMADAFRIYSQGKAQTPVYVMHPNDLADIHVKSAAMTGCSIFTVKMAGWSQALVDRGEPPSSGIIAVFDAETCRPIAIVQDDHLISDYRTAAAGALAAKILARKDARSAAIIGAGAQARLQAMAVCLVRPIETLFVWGRSPEKRQTFVEQLRTDLPNLTIEIAETPEQAVRKCDIIITATTAKTPIIEAEWLSPGQHLTSVGSDDATKCEVSPAALGKADLVVVDAKTAARDYGNVHRALIAHAPDPLTNAIEIGDILIGKHAGRRDGGDLTIASLVGLGIQDLAAVNTLFEKFFQKAASKA